MTGRTLGAAGSDVPAPAAPYEAALGSRVRRFAGGVVRQTLAEPVRQGRLRDLSGPAAWPYGLRAAVVMGYLAFGLAAVGVLVAGPVRRRSTLSLAANGTIGLPEGAVWLLLTLLSFGVALLVAASLHGPTWLRLLGLLLGVTSGGLWSLRTPRLAGSVVWPALAVGLLVGLVVLVLVRGRRRFAWWELAVLWALLAGTVLVGLAENRYSRSFGYDQTPLLLQHTASVLGYLALPTAVVAGAAVAELCVRLTVAATQQAQRVTRRGWPYAVLGVVVVLRGTQVVRQLAERDPVTDGWSSALPALVLVGLFALVGGGLLRTARRHGPPVVVGKLGDDLGRVALPVAAALLAVTLPLQLGGALLLALVPLDPTGIAGRVAADPARLVGMLTDPVRALVGLVLLLLAVRAARRGRAGAALVGGCVAVMLLGLARSLFVGRSTNAGVDPDALNLVATTVVLAVLAVAATRRRLDSARALTLAGALALTALFSSRRFVSDPAGALLGYSGAALVLFGLVWDLLTGSSWGNGDSRRFPRPTRVLLVLGNAVVTMSVLAYAALVRDGSTTVYLEPYAELGDFLLGTALVAAAAIALLAPPVSRGPTQP